MMQQLGALYTPKGLNAVGLDVRNVHFGVRPPGRAAALRRGVAGR